MNKFISSLKEKYNSLSTSNKLKLIVSIVIVLALIYYLLVNKSYRENEIVYDNLTAESIIENSYIIYNRIELQEINEIISKLSDINYSRYYVDDKLITIKDLYNYGVTENYKKAISNRKFSNKFSEIFMNLYSDNSEEGIIENFIDRVYYSDEYDMYLVKFKTIEDKNYYIGFNLTYAEGQYSIIFIQ